MADGNHGDDQREHEQQLAKRFPPKFVDSLGVRQSIGDYGNRGEDNE